MDLVIYSACNGGTKLEYQSVNSLMLTNDISKLAKTKSQGDVSTQSRNV